MFCLLFCFFMKSNCVCHFGDCPLVIKSYQFTRNPIFKSHVMKLAGCFCVSYIVFHDSKCVWISGSVLMVLKNYQFTQNLLLNFVFLKLARGVCVPFIVFQMIWKVCVTLAAVCWCLRATNLHKFYLLYDSFCLCHFGSCLLVLKSWMIAIVWHPLLFFWLIPYC